MLSRSALKVVAIALSAPVAWPGSSAQHRNASEPESVRHPGAVEIQIRNVNLRLAPDIALQVDSLRGRLQRTRPEVPVTFDDSASFTVEIDSARVAMTTDSLAALLNSYVLAYDAAPIKHIEVTADGPRLIQKGTIHKGVDLPFEIDGSLSTTEDGKIRVHADKIKSARIPVKGLLHLFGENLSKLVNQTSARGMQIVGDDIILDPATLTPPPHLEGRVRRAGVVNGKVVLTFDSSRRPEELKPPFRSAAYIYHRGGILRFGKLTMTDADLEIVGDRPGVFEFFQREYQKQLVAGYSKNTRANGLVAHMADYSHFRTQDRKNAATARGRR